MLSILIYDGELLPGEPPLPLLCEIEGVDATYGNASRGPLGEVEKILETCGERYTVGRVSGDCITVVVGRKRKSDVMPVVRIDVHARNGMARASIQTYDFPRWDAEAVRYAPEDDAVMMLRKIIASL